VPSVVLAAADAILLLAFPGVALIGEDAGVGGGGGGGRTGGGGMAGIFGFENREPI
jgi:hypothetical protein